ITTQGEPQVQFNLSSGFLESSLETLTWSLLSCLLLPHHTLSWTPLCYIHSLSLPVSFRA
uniref:Uncharacterized protein n=1 Tax=Marmota marmota marmota TaxID=9994 RepID=A0A8C5ZQ38_MARMA